jgi:hypothetical protein
METLTKDELMMLANLLAQAAVKVSEAKVAMELLAKLQRMIENEKHIPPQA